MILGVPSCVRMMFQRLNLVRENIGLIIYVKVIMRLFMCQNLVTVEFLLVTNGSKIYSKKIMKILVIDNDMEETINLSKYLIHQGHRCNYTTTAKNGLFLMDNYLFDIVFLESEWASILDGDGFEGICRSAKTSGSKIIMFTSTSFTDVEIQVLLQKGVHSVISKYVKRDNLLEIVESINEMDA